MPVDASIYGQLQPVKPVNQLANLAQALELQNSVQNNRLGQMKADEYERGLADTNKLNSLYQQALGADGQVDRMKLYQGAARQGLGSKIPSLQKSFAEADKATADLDKTRVETTAKKVDLVGQGAKFVMDNPTLENAHGAIDFWLQNGLYSPQQAAQLKAQVAANPQGIAQMAQQLFQQALNAKDQLSKYDTRNLGGTTETLAIDPVTGKTRTVNAVQNTQSPDNIATNATSRANNAATVGASLANAAATREVAKATRDAAQISKDRDTEMKLADDYRAQSKPFKEVSDAYKTINSTLDNAAKSPAATLAAATKFMKLLDPGSVVRESELGMALAASGVIDRAANYYNVLKSGRVLTPQQVKDFKNVTGQIYQAAQQQQQSIDSDYRKKAETYKLRPEMVTQDLGQNTRPPVDFGSPPTGSGKGGVIDFGNLR